MPALGVQGAAWATVITQLVTAAAGIWLMLRPRFGLVVTLLDLRSCRQTLGRLLRIGMPASVEQSVGALSVSAMTLLATHFSTLALASDGIVFRLMTFTFIPAVGISMATSILLRKSLGGGNAAKANRIAIDANMVIL